MAKSSPVIEDQHRCQQVVAQPTVPGAVGMPTAQVAQQPAGLDELDPVALPSGLVAETFGQMRFADSRGTAQQNVLLAYEIAPRGQIAQLFLRQFRVERPVEVFEGLV